MKEEKVVDSFIQCPKCGHRIPITEALTKPIEDALQRKYEDEAATQEQRWKDEFEQKLAAEKQKLAADAQEEATNAVGIELLDLRASLEEANQKLNAAREQELALRKEKRELLDRERNLDLEVSRQLDEERIKVEERVTEQLAEAHRLKDLEKDQRLRELTHKIEDLERKAKQGSQQTQGEAIEVELEKLLQTSYPYDQIEPVGKGRRGADVIQRVYVQPGQCCGIIVWESKNTKNWSDGWLEKLREDQRNARGDCAVLVSAVLPPDVANFKHIDGVWVTNYACAVALGAALRAGLVDVAMAKAAATGLSCKMEALYEYLSGKEFRGRVQTILETYVSMKDDLDREKRSIERQWAKREKQIDRVIRSVSGMYGDMQGMITALPDIEILELTSPAKILEIDNVQTD